MCVTQLLQKKPTDLYHDQGQSQKSSLGGGGADPILYDQDHSVKSTLLELARLTKIKTLDNILVLIRPYQIGIYFRIHDVFYLATCLKYNCIRITK